MWKSLKNNQARRTAACCLLLALALPLTAGERRVGVAWLKIPVGAREAALAGAGTAAAFGPQALVYNPAATARLAPFAISASYTKWLLDTHHQSVFATRDLGILQLGVGIASFAYGSVEYRDEWPTEEPLGTFSPLDLTAYLNLARSLGELAAIGITGRYFYSKIISNQASALGLDAGLRLRPLSSLTLGVAVTDFGRTMYYYYEPFWLPTRLRIGAAWNLPVGKSQFTLTGDAGYFFYNRDFRVSAGTEWTLNETFFLRTGWDPLNPGNRFSFGAGLRHRLIRLDYAWSPLGFNLGSAHRITLSFGY